MGDGEYAMAETGPKIQWPFCDVATLAAEDIETFRAAAAIWLV